MSEIEKDDAPYLAAVLFAARAARSFLEHMEATMEKLAPERSADLAAETEANHGPALREAKESLTKQPVPESLKAVGERFAAGFADLERAFELFTSFPTAFPPERIPRILGAMHHVARAQETFYLLRQPLLPFREYWQLPGSEVEDRLASNG